MAKEFKRQLLYINDDQVTWFTGLMNTSLKNLKFFIDETQRILKLKLTDDDKIQLKNFGSEFVNEYIRKLFPYSSASRKINLELLGISEIEAIINFYELHSDSWQTYDFELIEGDFKEPKNYVKAITETYSVYTDNETQNTLIAISDKIIELHKQIDSMNIHQLKGNPNQTPGASKLFAYSFKNGCIQTNRHFIETIGDNYKTFSEISEAKRSQREQQKRERAK